MVMQPLSSKKILKKFYYLFIFFCLFAFFSFPPKVFAQKIKVKVIRVIDGDTVVVKILEPVKGLRKREKVRYIAINTLEIHTSSHIPHPFARKAYLLNKKLVEGKVLFLEIPEKRKRGFYGRLLGELYFKNGTPVSSIIVREGLAFVCLFPDNEKFYKKLFPLEKQAIKEKKGIFSLLSKEPKNFILFGDKRKKRVYHPWSRKIKHPERMRKFRNFEEAFLEGYCPAKDTLPLYLYLYYLKPTHVRP